MADDLTGAEGTEVPKEPNQGDETRDLVNSIWRTGWSKGHRAGYRMGYTNGKSTLGRPWFFFTAMGFLVGGMLMGMTMQFLLTCGPEAPCGIQMPDGWGFGPTTLEHPND